MMFPFWYNSCWSYEPGAEKEHKKRKLRFLKMLRDGLEARLAALNAAIETVERQLSQEDNPS